VENKFGGWECSSGRRGGRVGTLGTWDDGWPLTGWKQWLMYGEERLEFGS